MSEGSQGEFDADVIVVGSGFGGSVAALRFAEAGQDVLVLERGDWVSRERHEADLDNLWLPHRHRYGFNELRPRGRNLVPWLGACVGGGSYVYAGTLKRVERWKGFPRAIREDDMGRWYDLAESIMDPAYYPDYPPYNEARATQLLVDVGAKLAREEPELVEDYGRIHLGISFAPPGGTPGAEFVNKHGAKQRYLDPREQSLLGGDIGAKNTLDRNYLHLAQERGARIEAMVEVDRIERTPQGWEVTCVRRLEVPQASSLWGRWRAGKRRPERTEVFRCRRLVLAAGSIGSTELLLRNRDLHGTLSGLSPMLGRRYTTNGDFLSLMFPSRGIFVGWLGFLASLVGGVATALNHRALAAGAGVPVLDHWATYVLGAGALVYAAGLVATRRACDPDIGTTNSDFIRFRGRDGETQGAYIETGRYPTPVRLALAVLLSVLGLWRPRSYGKIIAFTKLLRWTIPPFALFAQTWPVPLLKMGRDDAYGTFRLDEQGRAVIDYPWRDNRDFYAWLNSLARKVAAAAGASWAPNPAFLLTRRLEIPHNQGGVPMGEGPAEGVVDHAGRVFGHDDLMVLDGSILPVSPGPNPALTILAVAERAMSVAAAQLRQQGTLRAEVGAAADPPASPSPAGGEPIPASGDDGREGAAPEQART